MNLVTFPSPTLLSPIPRLNRVARHTTKVLLCTPLWSKSLSSTPAFPGHTIRHAPTTLPTVHRNDKLELGGSEVCKIKITTEKL